MELATSERPEDLTLMLTDPLLSLASSSHIFLSTALELMTHRPLITPKPFGKFSSIVRSKSLSSPRVVAARTSSRPMLQASFSREWNAINHQQEVKNVKGIPPCLPVIGNTPLVQVTRFDTGPCTIFSNSNHKTLAARS